MFNEFKARMHRRQEEDEIALLTRSHTEALEGPMARTSAEADHALRDHITSGLSIELLDRERLSRARRTDLVRNILAALLIVTCLSFPFIVMYTASYATHSE